MFVMKRNINYALDMTLIIVAGVQNSLEYPPFSGSINSGDELLIILLQKMILLLIIDSQKINFKVRRVLLLLICHPMCSFSWIYHM
jgi:hypothetical protein